MTKRSLQPRLTAPAITAAQACLALAACLLASAPVRAQEDNPFARPGAAQPAAQQPASPLDTIEFRGFLPLNDITLVNLFDTASSRSVHLVLGETKNGLTVSDYQAGDDSILVQSGGKERRVKIKKAQIVAMATPPPTPMPQPGPQQVGGLPPPPQGQPAMDDQEVRNRMERVAQEIRRRREMRRELMERAAQQQQQQ